MEFAKFHYVIQLASSLAGLRPASELDSVIEFGLDWYRATDRRRKVGTPFTWSVVDLYVDTYTLGHLEFCLYVRHCDLLCDWM